MPGSESTQARRVDVRVVNSFPDSVLIVEKTSSTRRAGAPTSSQRASGVEWSYDREIVAVTIEGSLQLGSGKLVIG